MRLPQSSVLKPLLAALRYSGLQAAMAPWTRGQGVIFTLHHVLPGDDREFAPNRILAITPEFLDAVIVDVRRAGFEIVSLDEVYRRLSTPGGAGAPFAAFTFDDGYRDNAQYAWPVLKRHNAPFTVYVPTDFPDGRGELWWLILEEVFRRSEQVSFTLDGVHFDLACASGDVKWQAYSKAYWALRAADEGRAREAVRRMAERVGIDVAETCRALVMDWDELRALAADPLVTIGAHTCSHFALARLDEAQARAEMQGSATRLAAELGRPCRHFSFPYGDDTSAGPREFRLARELGFKTAVTTHKGVVGARAAQQLTGLPRVSLNGEYQDLRYVRAFMSGAPFALLDAACAVGRGRWPGEASSGLAVAPSTR